MNSLEVSLPFYEFILDFLAGGPSPEEIIRFRPSLETQDRFYSLLQASRERTLTPVEDEELDHYIQIDRMVSLLKAKAYSKLDAKAI